MTGENIIILPTDTSSCTKYRNHADQLCHQLQTLEIRRPRRLLVESMIKLINIRIQTIRNTLQATDVVK